VLSEVEQQKADNALLRAAENGKADAVKRLISEGAAAGARDDYGNTPLHKAAMHGHVGVARLLLQEYAAEVNLKNVDGYTPLHLAALIGHLEEMEVLLDHAADSNLKNADGDVPLHYAAGKGQVELVKLLLDRGAEANSRNNLGDTPLKVAGTWQWISPDDKAEARSLLQAVGGTE
jgi:ankyrin repeat protein